MAKFSSEFEYVKVPASEETTGHTVKIKIGSKWYTVADTWLVPGMGDASEVATLIAQLLNQHFRGKK